MAESNVLSRTQIIKVDPASYAVSIINAGPVGPAGPVAIPPGGTTGQVLRKKSNANYDVEWVTLP